MKLPLLSSRELCGFLQKEGFVLDRQRGSHRIYKHADGRTTVVPFHAGQDIKRSLLLVILNDIGMTRDDFLSRYK